MSMKGQHQVRSCDWCDGLYDISLSDAETEKRFCSQECETDHDAEHPRKLTEGDLVDEAYEASA